MKKIVITALLSAVISVPAVAAEGKNSIGINYGFGNNGVAGVQGEFDISSAMPNKMPVSVQVFWKNYSQDHNSGAGIYQYSYNAFGAAAIYDFGSLLPQDRKLRPYAGVGLFGLNSNYSGPSVAFPAGPDSGGLYVTAGAKYDLTPQVSADLNLNNIGGLTIGVDFNF
jgi:opacity protein-like surface antigen